MRGLILFLVLTAGAFAQTTCVGCAGSGGGSATPGGSSGAVQFNDGGSLGGNGNLKFDKSTGIVSIGNPEPLNLPFGFASNSLSVSKDEDVLQTFTAGGTGNNGVMFSKSFGTNASPTNISDGTVIGSQYWTGFFGGAWGRVASLAAIYAKNETWNTSVPPDSTSNIGGILQWYVDPTPYLSPGGSTMSLVNNSEWQLISDVNNNLGLHVYGASDGSTSFAELNNGAPVSDGGSLITLDLAGLSIVRSTTPGNPSLSSEGHVYIKGGKLIVQYNDAGTVRYKSLDLTGTGVTWAQSTTAP